MSGFNFLTDGQFPRVRRPLLFSEYHPEMEGRMDVWVNPAMDFYDRHADLMGRMQRHGRARAAWRVVKAREIKFRNKQEPLGIIAGLLEITVEDLEARLRSPDVRVGDEPDAVPVHLSDALPLYQHVETALEAEGEAILAEQCALHADLWGCTQEETRALFEASERPEVQGFVVWLAQRAWEMVAAHRAGQGKATSGSFRG